jgi:hypothetical protein
MERENQTDKPPSPLTFALIALGLGLVGIAMLGHGLGVLNMEWFRPNPNTPLWVFAMIGVLLILAALICAARVANLPATYINWIFYSLLAVSVVMAHWLVFFAEGASCSVGGDNFIFRFSGLICQTIAGSVVILFDLIFVLVALTTVWRKMRKAS